MKRSLALFVFLLLAGSVLAGTQPTIFSGRTYLFGNWPPGVNMPDKDISNYPYRGYFFLGGTSDTLYTVRMFCGAASGRGWTFRMVPGAGDTTRIDSLGVYTTGNVTADTFKGNGSLLSGISGTPYDSAPVAGKAWNLEGKDTTALFNAKTLQGKDTSYFLKATGTGSDSSGNHLVVQATRFRGALTGNASTATKLSTDGDSTYVWGMSNHTTQGWIAQSAGTGDSARVSGLAWAPVGDTWRVPTLIYSQILAQDTGDDTLRKPAFFGYEDTVDTIHNLHAKSGHFAGPYWSRQWNDTLDGKDTLDLDNGNRCLAVADSGTVDSLWLKNGKAGASYQVCVEYRASGAIPDLVFIGKDGAIETSNGNAITDTTGNGGSSIFAFSCWSKAGALKYRCAYGLNFQEP